MQTLGLQPLQLTIPGAYYDSQIYDGRLYLWKANGSILTLDWNKMIESITVSDSLKTVLLFALQYGDDLYNNLLLKDADIKALIVEKFRDLVKTPIEIPESALYNFTISEQNNPFPFPHADSSIHYKTVYVGSQSGISLSACSYSSKKSINSKAEKLWDAPILSLSASHLTLALAAGSEGLFDYSLVQSYSQEHSEPRRITEEHSNFARWLYPGIFSSSYFNEGYLADFKISTRSSQQKAKTISNKVNPNPIDEQTSSQQLSFPRGEEPIKNISLIERGESKRKNREFQKLVPSQEIFAKSINDKSPVFTWGSHDKICLVTEDSIELVRYFSRAKKEKDKFISIGSVATEELSADIVSADSSFFGIVLEEDDGILIITSLLEYRRFSGEPVNWRVFPKSRNYTNQLHIIYENCLRIYSFTHDYFLDDQLGKKIGISFGAK